MTSKISNAPKFSALNIPHGFCTAPAASFHNPTLPASAHAGNTKSPIARPCAIWGKTIKKVTAGRKTRAGIIASGAPIMNARSRSFAVMAIAEVCPQKGLLLRLVHGLAADYGAQNFCVLHLWRQGSGDVLIEHDKVGQHARLQLTFLLFGEFCKS